jgi:hypothetical protein
VPDLKVIPGGTGELDDGLERLPVHALAAQVRTLRAEKAGVTSALLHAEEGMRELRASRAAFKALLSRARKQDPQAATIEAVLAYWRVTCHGPQSRVETPLDGKRAEVVRKTLRRLVENDEDPELASSDKDVQAQAVECATDRAVDRVKRAIDGAARFPFEGAYAKRFAEHVPGSKRKVDVIYILRDEVKMEMFERLHDGDARRIAYAHELHARLLAQPMLRQTLASLDPAYGELLARAIRWCQLNPTKGQS